MDDIDYEIIIFQDYLIKKYHYKLKILMKSQNFAANFYRVYFRLLLIFKISFVRSKLTVYVINIEISHKVVKNSSEDFQFFLF